MKLVRKQLRSDGVFGELLNDKDVKIASTLEHSYQQPNKSWLSKIPDGEYTCVRGPHRLHGMTHDFETFEITGVKGHANILFHMGNFNKDSEGCILLGNAILTQKDGTEMVVNSKVTFDHFMEGLKGVDKFTLKVSTCLVS